MKNTVIKNDIEAIKEYIEGLTNDEQVQIHNQWCRNSQHDEDEIHTNEDDFFNTYFDNRTLEAVRAVCYGEYNYTDSYVVFNGYGNLESFNNPSEHIDIAEIAEHIQENPEDYDIELEEPE